MSRQDGGRNSSQEGARRTWVSSESGLHHHQARRAQRRGLHPPSGQTSSSKGSEVRPKRANKECQNIGSIGPVPWYATLEPPIGRKDNLHKGLSFAHGTTPVGISFAFGTSPGPSEAAHSEEA